MEQRIREIIVGFDFSEGGRNALRLARTLAQQAKARLHIVTAIPGPVRELAKLQVKMPSRLFASMEDKTQMLGDVERLVRTAVAGEGLEGLEVSFDVSDQSPVGALLGAMDARDSDMIVVGDFGLTPQKDRAIGYDTERLIRRSTRPVFVANRNSTFPPRRILAPVDFSESADRVLGEAAELARMFGASLHVLHCVEFDPEPVVQLYGAAFSLDVMEDWRAHAATQLNDLVARAPFAGVSVSHEVVLARAYEKIPAMVQEGGFDMLVMGTHGASYAEELLLGGTADRVIRQARATICAIKPDSFVYRVRGDVRVSGS